MLWLSLFIPSGATFPLFSSSILGTYQPGDFIFQCNILLPFHAVHGGSQGNHADVVCHSVSVDHVLSELSTMTHLSWVALHRMAHSFIELDEAVIYIISLFSFLYHGFYSICLLIDENRGLWKLPDGGIGCGENWVLLWWSGHA